MRAQVLNAYPCHVAGAPAEVTVGPDQLVVGGQPVAYVDIDGVEVRGHDVVLDVIGAGAPPLERLGRGLDDFLREFLAARAKARRAALLAWGGDPPIDSYVAHPGQGGDDHPVDVHLFPDGLTIEPVSGAPTVVPFALLEDVGRDGFTITLTCRGIGPVAVRRLGARTEEFLADLDRARAARVVATAEAYGAMDPALAGFGAPDGWAVDAGGAGRHWSALRAAVAGQARGTEVDTLERLATDGGGELRLGIKLQRAGEPMPFVLAAAGGRVAVEASDTEARATYVFAAENVDQLNVVLILLEFRREALYLPEDGLGRWAVAVRLLDSVRWARQALVARVVHDDSWAAKVESALRGGKMAP